jgi:hypothetical protein
MLGLAMGVCVRLQKASLQLTLKEIAAESKQLCRVFCFFDVSFFYSPNFLSGSML